MTNYEWARRFVTPHPLHEHLTAASLYYLGNHVYWCWDHGHEVGIILRHNGTRIILPADNPRAVCTIEFMPLYCRWERGSWPLAEDMVRSAIALLSENLPQLPDALRCPTMFFSNTAWAVRPRSSTRNFYCAPQNVSYLKQKLIEALQNYQQETAQAAN